MLLWTFVEVVVKLKFELKNRFPKDSVLDAMSIVYPQYWRVKGAEKSFS